MSSRTHSRGRYAAVAMASERFLAALNDQIAREFAAAHQYVAVGNYYAAETFPRLASFFYEQARRSAGTR